MDKPSPYHPAGLQTLNLFCPHCRAELRIQRQQAGATVACPNCGSHFQSPLLQTAMPQSAPVGPAWGHQQRTPLNAGIKVCTLVSGIWNIVVGVVWIATLCGAVVGVPLVVLAIFEIIYFAQADNKPLPEALSQAKLLAVFEIISGLFNGISFVCGVVSLVLASSHE